MADQQYCLRWNNHQTTLVSIFDTLLQRDRFTDCTLSAEGQSIAAHKILLTACSPYFENVLSRIPYDKHPVIILRDVTFAELKALMDYMYRGEVNISQDQLQALLKVAEFLQIKGLSDSGEKEKPEKRPAPPPPPAVLQPRSSGLTIEHTRRSNQTQILDLPLDSLLNRNDGNVSPVPRKRKRLRRRSSTDDLSVGQIGTPSLTESHENNNSRDPAGSIPPNVAALLSKTAVISEQPLLDHVLPDSAQANVDLPKVEPQSDLDLIQPKEEYVDDHDDSVENITLDDDDMDDMDLSQAGPSHGGEGSSSQGYPPSWHQASDRSNDEVFMAAQEAVSGQRDSQGHIDLNKHHEVVVVHDLVHDVASSPMGPSHTDYCAGYLHTDYNHAVHSRHQIKSEFVTYSSQSDNNLIVGIHNRNVLSGSLQRALVAPPSRHVCHLCDRSYSLKGNLRKHLQFECGVEPQFKCPLCPHRSKRKLHLKGHMKIHKIV